MVVGNAGRGLMVDAQDWICLETSDEWVKQYDVGSGHQTPKSGAGVGVGVGVGMDVEVREVSGLCSAEGRGQRAECSTPGQAGSDCAVPAGFGTREAHIGTWKQVSTPCVTLLGSLG